MAKKKEEETRIPFRINILFIIIFLLFSGLIIQLGVIQIVEGEEYQTEIDRTIDDTANNPYPRGKIFDRNGNVVVDNKAMYAITYTPPKRIQPAEKLKLAEKLTDYISVTKKELKRVTDFNKQEYFYLKNTEEVQERVTEEETKDMDDGEEYRFFLEQITDDELDSIDKDEMKVIAIKRELDKAYALTPQIIKKDGISANEYARIAENLTELPGISVSSDWDRVYPYKGLFRPIFGGVTTQEQGVPAEDQDEYLAKGYNRNDRIGKSGLELQYEDVLRGRKERVKYTTTKSGEVIDSEVLVEGERGKDLQLTLDMDFQEKVDDIVLSELKKARSQSSNWMTNEAIAVVMNPKTGEILAMSGQTYDKEKDEYTNSPFSALYNQYEPGSSIKGATVLAGYNAGVIDIGDGFYDSPIRMAGPQVKKSLSTSIGYADDLTALKRSSNVYMFYIALRMMGDYRYPFPNGGYVPSSESAKKGINEFRNNFDQFGLGSYTGIDLPSEATGFKGENPPAGNVMDYAIGQFDTYTALQLVQYVSTIANDGVRVAPKLVNSIHYPSTDNELDAVSEYRDTKIMNELEMSLDEVKRVQDGFYKVFNEPGGTGYSYWNNKKYKAAGKTGTAQTRAMIDDKLYDLNNLTLVGYAPYDDPEIAFAVIVPSLANVTGQYPATHHIGTRIMDMYFDGAEEETEEEEE